MEVRDCITRWKNRSRKQLECSNRESDPAAKRMLEHGAHCYANAAFELAEALRKNPIYPVRLKVGTFEVAMSWGVAMILIGAIGMVVAAIWK